jgi:hypothetical protein
VLSPVFVVTVWLPNCRGHLNLETWNCTMIQHQTPVETSARSIKTMAPSFTGPLITLWCKGVTPFPPTPGMSTVWGPAGESSSMTVLPNLSG